MSTSETVSAYNTPQAVDDFYGWLEDAAESAGYVRWLDVMANDLGGKAKTLFAIDDGSDLAELFQSDAAVTFESSALGARIYLVGDKIAYDLSPLAARVDALGAGETLIDTLTYSIRLGNGTLSFGEVAVTIVGTDDLSVVSGADAATVFEDGSAETVSGKLSAIDVDGPDDAFAAVAVPAASALGYGTYTVDPTGNWSYSLDNAHPMVNGLATGQTLTDSFTVTTADGVLKVVTISIEGSTDGPTLPEIYLGADPRDFDDLLGTGANIEGNEHDNPIQGTSGADVINGLAGNDTIDADHGADTVYGGAGDDVIIGNVGLDSLYGQAGEDQISGNENIDTIYGGSGNDQLDGGSSNDLMFGGSGNDVLAGAGGNDVLIGGFGADTLTGGNLDDTFRFIDTRDTGDTITDFVAGHDRIDLADIDANSALAGNQAFLFGGTTATAYGVWLVTDPTGGVEVRLDSDGDLGTVEFVVKVAGVTGLGAADFVL